ncbi:MAG: glycosyltransferase family 2 protein [Cyanobacteria bacterium CRU_2_1]|nr:glycosyltransferase family 2 protein [Cyanobacteria bacterium RU_5_0]NJR60190.1 glycosyltransferase family 2 protein [Cyanobacteria bacterium CRU_2_1]
MTNPTTPVVSIIMPMYNAERYVVAALRSVLQERNILLEVIVINDRSTDASLKEVHKVNDKRVRVLNNNGKGIADALNTGLQAARGRIITRCDADDLYPAKRIAQQAEWLVHHPNFGAVCGNYGAINSRGQQIILFDCGSIAEEVTSELQSGKTRTHFCTFAIRTEALREIGGFRQYFLTGEDVDLQLRLGDICRVWYLPDTYYHYRLHSTSVTHTKSSTEREFFDFVAREFQLQRRSQGVDDIQRGCPPPLPKKHDKAPLSAAQHIQNFLLGRAWQEYQQGQTLQALMTGLRSLLTLPTNVKIWRSLLALSLKSVSLGIVSSINQPVILDRK